MHIILVIINIPLVSQFNTSKSRKHVLKNMGRDTKTKS